MNAATFVPTMQVQYFIINLTERNFPLYQYRFIFIFKLTCVPRRCAKSFIRKWRSVAGNFVNPVRARDHLDARALTKARGRSADFPRASVRLQSLFRSPKFFPGIDTVGSVHARRLKASRATRTKGERSRTHSFRSLARMSGRTKRPRPALPFREPLSLEAWQRTCLESRLARVDPIVAAATGWKRVARCRFLNPGNGRT